MVSGRLSGAGDGRALHAGRPLARDGEPRTARRSWRGCHLARCVRDLAGARRTSRAPNTHGRTLYSAGGRRSDLHLGPRRHAASRPPDRRRCAQRGARRAERGRPAAGARASVRHDHRGRPEPARRRPDVRRRSQWRRGQRHLLRSGEPVGDRPGTGGAHRARRHRQRPHRAYDRRLGPATRGRTSAPPPAMAPTGSSACRPALVGLQRGRHPGLPVGGSRAAAPSGGRWSSGTALIYDVQPGPTGGCSSSCSRTPGLEGGVGRGLGRTHAPPGARGEVRADSVARPLKRRPSAVGNRYGETRVYDMGHVQAQTQRRRGRDHRRGDHTRPTTTLATGSENRAIQLWDIPGGQALGAPLPGVPKQAA